MAPVLSAEDWLVLFPEAPSGADDAAGPRGYDPAAPLRETRPLSPAVLVGLLRRAPLAAASLRVQLLLAPVARRALQPALALSGVLIPVYGIAPVAYCNDGSFGTKQIVVAGVCFLVSALADFGSLLAMPGYLERYLGGYVLDRPALDHHRFALAGRYFDAIGRKAADVGVGAENGDGLAHTTQQAPWTSKLVAHDASDALCPCPLKSCGGSLASRLGLSIWLQLAYIWMTNAAFLMFLLVFTSLFTLRSCTFSTPWIIAVFTVHALSFTTSIWLLAAMSYAPDLASLGLQARLLHRGANLCLDHILEPFRAAVVQEDSDKSVTDTEPDVPATARSDAADEVQYRSAVIELCALHRAAAADLSAGPFLYVQTNAVAVYIAGAVVCGALEIFAAGCLPMSAVGPLLYILLCANLMDLLNLALWNGTITLVLDAYTRARDEIRYLSACGHALRGPRGAAFRAVQAPELASLDALLGSFLELGRHRARIAGFAVTSGVVRSYLATVLTLGLGLASVLHNFGVLITVQSVCPVH